MPDAPSASAMTPSNQPPETDALPPLEAAILSPASSLPGPGIPTAPSCNMRFFQEGEVIFTEGSRSDTAYIIESGQVEIFLGSGDDIVQLSVLEPGDIFGEMGLIDNSPRSASAQAIAACQCITISTTQIAERIAASHPLVKLLISISLHRNRAYNQYFKALPSTSHGSLPNLAATEKAYTKNPDHRKIIDEIKLESDLHKAVGNDELQPYYQPLFSIRHNSIVGFESLLRWQSPGRGMVSPGQFMSLAEETSL
ncbi:MAG: cyclic nucleotide-binding domain-containing protein, partial [Leptolyngbya sp.]|nr:cyclic nucleotide-binding domain-containing protein [Leptolyngbya sp.]